MTFWDGDGYTVLRTVLGARPGGLRFPRSRCRPKINIISRSHGPGTLEGSASNGPTGSRNAVLDPTGRVGTPLIIVLVLVMLDRIQAREIYLQQARPLETG
jgi:hypothetical protein